MADAVDKMAEGIDMLTAITHDHDQRVDASNTEPKTVD
jgi:hypothetical protein